MLDEPVTLVVGQAVRVEVVEPTLVSAGHPADEPAKRPSRFGFAKGWFEMSDDFNDPLEDFAEYM